MLRERTIVLAAAGKVSGSTRRWLQADERGVFEQQTRELLLQTKERAETLGLTPEEVNAQISTYIAYLATETQLRKKGASATR